MLKLKFKAKKVIIGVDLVKDVKTLISAYDDKKGVTAKFNKNILKRINTELGGDINLNSISIIIYNKSKNTNLKTTGMKTHNIKINGSNYLIKKNEEIHTENSHKNKPNSFKNLVGKAGWKIDTTWVDDKGLFSVHCLL